MKSLVGVECVCCSFDRYVDWEFGDFNLIGFVVSFGVVKDVKIVYFCNLNVFMVWFCILNSYIKMVWKI